MRFYPMASGKTGTVTVPQLCGGLNVYDQPGQVNDNQLTQADNVWWHRGALRSRPGINRIGSLPSGYLNRVQMLNEREMLIYHFNAQHTFPGGSNFFATLVQADGTCLSVGSPNNSAYFYSNKSTPPEIIGVRVDNHKGYDWCFFMERNGLYTYNSSTETWHRHMDTQDPLEPYVPWVFINGRGNNAPGGPQTVALETNNLLTRCIRCAFTTDGVSDTFTVPFTDVTPYKGILTVFDGESSRDVEGEGSDLYSSFLFSDLSCKELGIDQSYSHVDIELFIDENNGISHVVAYPDGDFNRPIENFILPKSPTPNNLQLWLYAGQRNIVDNDICQMRQAIWFGGLSGSNGTGTHLFVAGHPSKPNLLHWSEVNDPTYFPKNNYAYVGEDSSPITALAKQGELLVIFREHDLYCTRYVEGTVPTQEDLSQRTVIETNVHKAVFPMAQLHPNIGCDCPHTVRLVNNKLVWLTGDGRVHILTESNQHSERNIRDASPLIERQLQQHSREELQQALAGELDGYYTLLVGNRMYLLDCQTSAFTSFQYYSREETAQKALPWYVWTLPDYDYKGLVYDGNSLVLLGGEILYAPKGDTDNGQPIHSRFTTKQFSLGRPDKRKSLSRLCLEAEDIAGCHIQLRYLTDQGDRDDGCALICDGTHNGQTRLFRTTPHLRQIRHFALQADIRQPFALTGITVTYNTE